jgi:hypothetical protein
MMNSYLPLLFFRDRHRFAQETASAMIELSGGTHDLLERNRDFI